MKRFLLAAVLGALLFSFWLSPNFQEIAAGVAIFLFGMLMLEDGFKLFSGGVLERTLERMTRSVLRSVTFGIVSTTIMQSSSLVSVITISFLSAGLISLIAGVGIIFGANIGTTTGAWLVAGIGLKVDIASYAMPMLALGAILVFQNSKYLKGAGYVLAGVGFLFLGIHYMKSGFETFKEQIDLTRFAMTGFAGLAVYTLVGAAATIVMQSSHATMVLVITALAAGQISYENALALAIGANIGTTVTAVLGALSANFQGKRLALAHIIFNVVTAAVALALIQHLRNAVDEVSAFVGIADNDFALKLAVFHTIFNVLGVVLMLPLLRLLIRFLERVIVEQKPDVSKPRYLNAAVDDYPATIESALRKEVGHLYDNAVEVIGEGLNIRLAEIYASTSIPKTVAESRTPIDVDLSARYEHRVKTLYAAIVEFATRIGDKDMPPDVVARVYDLLEVARRIVQAVKAVKHMRRNTSAYTSAQLGAVTDLYNGIRTEIAQILAEINKLEHEDADERSSLWLDDERVQIEASYRNTSKQVEDLIRKRALSPHAATSFLNDSGYAFDAMRDLMEAAKLYYLSKESGMAEVERILSVEEDDAETISESAEGDADVS
ncbi:MAG: sodium:phosphate symporter [Hyphomicrobiales bacterium]|nr:MAG: sodium:phosphate symporter [Hyphomicrobiales bacterium]